MCWCHLYGQIPANRMITVLIHVSKRLTSGKTTRAMTIERTMNVNKALTLEKTFNGNYHKYHLTFYKINTIAVTSTATEVMEEILPFFVDQIEQRYMVHCMWLSYKFVPNIQDGCLCPASDWRRKLHQWRHQAVGL